MGLFAKGKCERCGKSGVPQSAEKPICDECDKELTLLVEACQENRRSCPIDGATMSKSIVHMLVIDRCPECQGVWLDGGELEKVFERASDESLAAMTRGLWVPFP